MRYHEWQVGVGISYQVDLFVPYIALKYSNASVRYRNLPAGFLSGRKTGFNAKNRGKFGLALGTSLTTGRLFALNLELRMIDEQAITLSGELKF